MTDKRSLLLKAALWLAVYGCACAAASAQGFMKKDSQLPDASHYYMSRMQVQLIDDSPIVNHQVNPPGAAGGASPGSASYVPRGLPRAGFNSYTSDIPSLSTSLPKTNNGVPPKLPPSKALPAGNKGQSGRLGSAKAAKPAVRSGPPTVEAYAPYKGYNPNAMDGSVQGGTNSNSQANVKGSVLHWARAHH